MSVLIPIDIPDDCSVCPCLKTYGCGVNQKLIPFDFMTYGRPDWCPLQEVPEKVSVNLFDEMEVHENCTVEILKNTATGQISVGWYKNDS